MLKKLLFLSLLFISSITQSIIYKVEVLAHKQTGQILILLSDVHRDLQNRSITRKQQTDLINAAKNYNPTVLVEDLYHGYFSEEYINNYLANNTHQHNTQDTFVYISIENNALYFACGAENFIKELHPLKEPAVSASPLIFLCHLLKKNKINAYNTDPRRVIEDAILEYELSYTHVLNNEIQKIIKELEWLSD